MLYIRFRRPIIGDLIHGDFTEKSICTKNQIATPQENDRLDISYHAFKM